MSKITVQKSSNVDISSRIQQPLWWLTHQPITGLANRVVDPITGLIETRADVIETREHAH